MAEPTAPYLDPYHDAAQKHGSDFDVTLWASERTQRLRFKVFAEMVYLQGKRILDAGCSRGDFASYLLEHQIGYDRFIGVDGVPQVIDFANTRNLPRATFHAGDFVRDPKLLSIGQPQVIAISGTLNTMDLPTVLGLLDAAWDAAAQTLIFNFLPDTAGPGAPPQQDPAHRLPTMRLIDWALKKTWDVRYRQDYMPHGHDATIAMGKHG